MEKRKLGSLEVSKICLGSMTWGEQNTQVEAFEQLDYAVDNGVNFIDTAEVYPIVPKEETSGDTERYIGRWLKQSGKRNQVVLATKITGPHVPWIREGKGVDCDIELAVDASLSRLQTDVIDLYQVHWPTRSVPLWGKMNYEDSMYLPNAQEQMLKAYSQLDALVKKGKIREIGLSNETAWGLMTYQRIGKENGLKPFVSCQNCFSIVRRDFEVNLSEVALSENIGLLAYSPLAGGLLTGKYRGGVKPEGSRFHVFPDMMGYYDNPRTHAAVTMYQSLAEEVGTTITKFCLAFINDRSFVTSNIIGATNLEQLQENIASAEVVLNEDIRKRIDDVFKQYPNPGNY